MVLPGKTYPVFFAAGVLCCCSCTHRLPVNKPVQKIYITTGTGVRVIAAAGATSITKAYIVPRSNKPLAIQLTIDSTQKTVYLDACKNYGRFLNMKYVFSKRDSGDSYAYKGWTYPKKNVVTVTGGVVRISRFMPVKTGTVNITISPGVQIFHLRTHNGQYNSAGILGLEAGVHYFYRENRFLSFNAGAATDGLPLPIDYFGPGYIQRGSAICTSISNNIIKGRFAIGYGLSLSRLYWTALPINDSLLAKRKTGSTGLGPSFSAGYRVRENLRTGLLYQPTLLNLNHTPLFSYQYYMAVHCTWNLWNSRKAACRSLSD